jgi:transposase
MTKVFLTELERENLIKLAKRTSDPKIAIKARVILALDAKELTQLQIAKTFLLDETTIISWRDKYLNRANQDDYQTWANDKYLGDQGNLSQYQLLELDKYIDQEIVTNCLQVVEFVSKNYGLNYSQSGIIKILHKLNFTYKYTKHIPAKADTEAQKDKWEEIMKIIQNLTQNERIGFMDAVHPIHNTENQKCWIKVGTEKLIKSNTGRNRLNINGVIDINSEQLDITTDLADSINAQATIELFEKLVAKALNDNPNLTTFYLVSDNAKYYKCKLTAAYLAKPTCKIKLIFLTPYSPNLNLIERLWHYLRKNIIGVKYRENFKEFKADITNFLEEGYKLDSAKIRKFIGTKPHYFKVKT